MAARKKRALVPVPVDPDAMWVKLPLSSETVAIVRKRVDAVGGLIESARALLGPVDAVDGALRSFLEQAIGVATDVENDVKRVSKAMDARRRRRAPKRRPR